MATTYTEEAILALIGEGGENWGTAFNGIITRLDAGQDVTLTAGENIAAEDCVCIKRTDGKMYRADNDDLALSCPIGIAPAAVTSGQEGRVRWFGWIDVDCSFSVGDSVSFAHGDLVYAAAVPGRLTKTRPLSSAPVGMAKSDTDASWDTRILIDPGLRRHYGLVQQVMIPIENLGAGADITTREIFVNPMAVELVRIGILSQGASAGIDAGNTCVILIEDDASNTIVTQTYNAVTVWPDGNYEDLGALDATHKILTAGEHLEISVTNGATADPPAFLLIIEYALRF